MDLERLAQEVALAQDRKGLSDYALEHELGRPGGKAFNAKQLKRWKDGERIQALPRPVVLRLIEVLDMPPDETAELAGVWPPKRTADMLRRLDMHLASSDADELTNRQLRYDPELVEQIDRLRLRRRPTLALVGGRVA